MMLVLVPSLRDIFPNEKLTLKDIFSELPIGNLAGIVSALNTNLREGLNQKLIFNITFANSKQTFKTHILKRYFEYIRSLTGSPPVELQLFNSFYLTELLSVAYLEGTKNHFCDTIKKERVEELFIKAYLIQASISQKRQVIPASVNIGFNKLTWPFISDQFEFNIRSNPLWTLAQLYSIVRYLKSEKKYDLSVKNFEADIRGDIKVMYGSIVNISHTLNTISISNITTYQYFLKQSAHESSFLEPFIANDEIINSSANDRFRTIKEFPLYNPNKGVFFVTNWDFLINKMYPGFLLDFYYKSGEEIKSIHPKFPDFKSEIGEVYEQYLFKPILDSIFHKKHFTKFSSNLNGLPDYYLRIHNKIYLFECKDCLVPANIILNASFDEIEDYFKKIFVNNKKGNPKGITQLYNQITYLNDNNVPNDEYLNDKSRRKVEIYPIVVVTDKYFKMPGLNNYLKFKFAEISEENDFKRIHEPVVIDLEFFFTYGALIGNSRFGNLIETYNKKTKESKNGSLNKWFQTNASFGFTKKDFGKEKIDNTIDELMRKSLFTES